ncbi:glycosyltransferase [Ursidibacter sp. B-7004-1]
MKKILMIDTTWPINSRTERFRITLSKRFDVLVVAWNRGKKIEQYVSKTYLLEKGIGYGNQIKKLLALPFFIKHIYFVCEKEKPDLLFASHWDSLICSVLVRFLLRRDVKIIYDCLDLPTSSNESIRRIISFLERKCLNLVSLTILASRYFKDLYGKDLNTYVFENYPSIELLGSDVVKPDWAIGYDESVLETSQSISWIGVVRYFEIINNILLSIKGTNVKFFVFGDGPDIDKVKTAVKEYKLSNQVVFFGRYSPRDLRYIYNLSSLVWAAYPTNDFNAVYAISNKYFECSFFEKRIILSKKTKMAENVKGNDSVILVDEYSPDDISRNILCYLPVKKGNYTKYQEDISWEQKEFEFLGVVERLFLN